MISVIVIGRNEGARLGACFQSVREALGPLCHEVIYVDSHSQDESVAVARAHGARCFLVQAQDTTPGLARLVGTMRAGGEYLLFLDADMRLCKGFVQAAMKTMAACGCEAVTGQREDVYVRGGEVVGRRANFYGCTAPRLAPEFGGALFIRAQALQKAGGWAADTIACEEAELHARLLKAHCRVMELPVPMIIHEDAVREARSPLGVLFSRRRLGEGQAFRCALDAGAAGAYLRFARQKFLFYALDWASLLLTVTLAGAGFCAACFLQAVQMGYLLSRGKVRSFVTQKLFFFAFPAGLASYKRRSRESSEA